MKGPPLAARPFPTLVEALDRAAASRRGVTFVGEDERERWLAWSDVAARAGRAAAAYAALGVRPGDRVAIVLPTGPAFLDAFLGAWLAAAVPVPLPGPSQLGHLDAYLEALERMVRASGARLLVTGGATRRLVGGAVDRLRLPLGGLDAGALADTPARIRRDVAPGDVAVVQFAWGAGGVPRPVAFTHGALAAQVAARNAALALGVDDVLVSWLSVSHDTGLVGCLLAALAQPAFLVLLAREAVAARPSAWLRALARHRGTVTVAPASAYGRAALAPAVETERLSLASLRLAVARAEPGATEALRHFAARYEAHGLDPGALVQSWGLADPAMTASLGSPGQPLVGARVDAARLAGAGEVAAGAREVTPVGHPLPGVALEVRDDAGGPLPPGRLGHLWIRAPEQLQGTGAEGPGGWLDTGDLGFVLEGALYLHARREDLVRIRGARHAPDEFEAALHGLPGLGAAVALTMPADRVAPATDGALLVLAERAAGEADDAALAATVSRAVLARAGVAPHTVQILPPGTLPRTGTGRLRRGEALRRWRAGTLSPPRGVNPVRLALDAARSQLAWVRVRLRG